MCIKFLGKNTYTVWHENLTAIKFYGLSKLLKQKKLGYRNNLVSLQHDSKR